MVMNGIKLTATPARHFSGRSFTRGKTLWSSFVLNLNEHKLFLGGDSGYGEHFKLIGEKHGPFDLAILECGQYGNNWPYIHMLPEQTVMAGEDLKAKTLLPVHWAKFELSMHAWNEPINRFVIAANKNKVHYSTPLIGEPVEVGKNYPQSVWWNS
jgi:L-ascorbate metabolism protein UlaG (beta-lactamase superfamily)